MVTKEQAVEMYTNEQTGVVSGYKHNEFHAEGCKRVLGPRGGVKEIITRVRRSGKTKIWKTRPLEFRVPVKWGLYESGYINHDCAHNWHVASECPLLKGE